MSQVHSRKSKAKKLEESFSDHHSDNYDDTELQTADNPNPLKGSNHQTRSQSRETKVQKKEEEDKTKVSKNQLVKKLKELKIPQDDEKVHPSRTRKYEDVKSVKDYAQDEQESKYIKNTKAYKRNRKNKARDHEKMQENEKRAHEIIEKLDEVYDQDVELYKQGKLADKKLKYILEIEKKLKEIELSKIFLNMDGHQLFIQWLLPNHETRQETSLTVKIHVLNLLTDMKLTKENIEAASELEKVVKRYRKSRYETLRNLSSVIVEKWKILRALPTA